MRYLAFFGGGILSHRYDYIHTYRLVVVFLVNNLLTCFFYGSKTGLSNVSWDPNTGCIFYCFFWGGGFSRKRR